MRRKTMVRWLWLISFGCVLGLLPIHELKARDKAGDVLDVVYGAISTACSQDADADTGEHNRLTGFTVNRSRNQYSGSITVVGFARSEGLVTEVASNR